MTGSNCSKLVFSPLILRTYHVFKGLLSKYIWELNPKRLKILWTYFLILLKNIPVVGEVAAAGLSKMIDSAQQKIKDLVGDTR
jgi:hypothetical protein